MGGGRGGGALGPSTKLVASGREESLGDPEVSLREMEMESQEVTSAHGMIARKQDRDLGPVGCRTSARQSQSIPDVPTTTPTHRGGV